MTYKILHIEENKVHDWTLEMILDEINRDHSHEFTPYNEKDWREGWNEWVKEGGSYKLVNK